MLKFVYQRLFGALILLCAVLPAQASIEVEHEVGTLALTEAPKRIVVLEYSFIDALASIGISPIGVADDLDPQRIIPAVRDLLDPWTSVGMRSQPSLEVIARLKPDLIIGDIYRHRVSYDDLSQIAPTMLLKSRGESYLDALEAAKVIGKAVGKEPEMLDRIEQHKQLMDNYRERFKSDETIQFTTVNERGMWMHGPLSFTGSLFSYLGLKSALPDLQDNHLIQANLEVLLRVNPDWLFYVRSKPVTVLESWEKNPLFKLLNISKTGQMVQVSSALWSLNRGMLAAEGIAKELDAALNH
ncbi:Fe(3+) dicitrate ABC transporter substrate-binding protein [Psychromonas sp. KJ10-2]|uniref:Fe(3+) dicitrate ABC transporter substrate-binding protein n=1 Tax=Psychromonas sp. KJ10-2 TaxID=3391822 RepID=UPI0039B524C0